VDLRQQRGRLARVAHLARGTGGEVEAFLGPAVVAPGVERPPEVGERDQPIPDEAEPGGQGFRMGEGLDGSLVVAEPVITPAEVAPCLRPQSLGRRPRREVERPAQPVGGVVEAALARPQIAEAPPPPARRSRAALRPPPGPRESCAPPPRGRHGAGRRSRAATSPRRRSPARRGWTPALPLPRGRRPSELACPRRRA
jgi:hypothetical protein